ncbi:hypothetical protein [Nocardioides sp.]|uniref:hypothetical protein n=1 Tax=Nocardioides sp. TaxID=35761 RepID=UPI002B2760BF|nr:hypothetical protein [Nocardioides sp.]
MTTELLTARSLAHPSTDPPTLVQRARAALGWQGSEFLVSLQGYDELMETLEVAGDLDALVRLGDPTSPPLRLLRAINASTTGLRVTRMTTVAAPWRWVRVGEGAAELSGVALRQQAYADVVGALGRAGLTFRVLADDTPVEEVLAVGRALGSAVVDVDEVSAAGDAEPVAGYLDNQDALTYGLVSREQRHHAHVEGETHPTDVVWLSMRAPRESAGTLMQALEQVSALGLNLDFLHSDPREPEQHDFYLGFRASPADLDALQAALAEVHFSSNVLASFVLPSSPEGTPEGAES